MLLISPTAKISPLADIEDSVRGSKIIIEDQVMIDAFVKIKPAGGSGNLRIGARSVVGPGCIREHAFRSKSRMTMDTRWSNFPS